MRNAKAGILLVVILSVPAIGRADFANRAHRFSDLQLSQEKPSKKVDAKGNEILPELAKLGTKLFFPAEGLGDFVTRYSTEDFGTGKTFVPALNAEDERAAALAIYDMMRPLNLNSWSKGYDLLEKKLKKPATTANDEQEKPSEKKSLMDKAKSRWMVAFQNWGENIDTKKANDNPPSDPKLKGFYEAFKQVKAEKEAEKKELAKIMKSAAGKDGDGNEADKGRLYNDPKFAVGPHVLGWLAKLAKEGDKATAKEWLMALGHSKGENIVLTANYNGKPFNLFLKKNDENALFAALQDPVIRMASFVGNEHPATANAENWEFKNGALAFREDAKDAYAATGPSRSTAVGLRGGNNDQIIQ